MMGEDWQLSDVQQQAQAKRQEVGGWERILDRLDQQHELAASAEGAFNATCERIRTEMAAIRIGPHPVRLVGSGARPDVIFGPSDAQMAAYRALERQLQTLEAERRRWLDDHVIRWSSGGIERSYTLTISSVDGQRGRARVALGVASSQLAGLEDRLTAGEALQTGATAPDLVAHRATVERLRQQVT